MIPTTTHASAEATPQQLELLHLPDELIEHIAIRIRGVDSLLNFARTCERFAGVSRTPSFAAALTDNLVAESGEEIEKVESVEARAARIYDLAGRTGGNLKPRHLQRLFGLLSFKNTAELHLDVEIWCQLLSLPQFHMPSQLSELFESPGASKYFNEHFFNRNRSALVSAALLSGQINSLDDDLKAYAKKVMSTVWKNPSDAICALSYLLRSPTDGLERKLIGHAATGTWLFLQENTFASASDSLRDRALSLLSWCASRPIEIKIGLLEKIVEWRTARYISKPSELEKESDSDDPMELEEGCASENDFNGSSIEMDVMRSDYRYFWELHKSAKLPESLDSALAQRFFTMLCLVHDDMVRNTIQADMMEQHLNFAKMLPAIPWRENGKACLHWLENVIRHHKGTATYSSKPPSDSQESSNDEDESDEFPPLVGYVRYTPFPIDAWKALIPQGIFTDKELAYLVQSIAVGTFSWEALEQVDPQPSPDNHGSATH